MTDFSGKRILVVEDEPIVAMCIEDMILDLGCTVLGPASRLDEGLKLASDVAIDAAILDVNLGQERSYPIADVLRQRAIPFAFATGYGRSDYGGGQAALIEKPYRAEQIAAAIAGMLFGTPDPD